ncbi:MAG: hypothetical protein QW719_01915 [Candidatus Micrarchaeaceae archaeon]
MKTNEASALINTFKDLVQALDEAQQSMLLAAIGFERDSLLQICNALLLDDTQKEKKEQLLRSGIKKIQVAQMIWAYRESFIESFSYAESKSYDEYED